MPKAYLFSGLGSSVFPSFRHGNLDLAKNLTDIGFEAKHYVWNNWEFAFHDIYLSQQAKESTIILVGHSNGVLACAKLAERLASHDIKVKYVAAIDPTVAPFPAFRGNVSQVHEFHATRGAVPLVRRLTRGYLGTCKFVDGWSGVHEVETIKGSHTDIAKDKKVLDRILESVVSFDG